jgi:hypothetical protein
MVPFFTAAYFRCGNRSEFDVVSKPVSTFLNHVLGIVAFRTFEQVSRTAARRIIARMQYAIFRIQDVRKGVAVQEKSYNMSADVSDAGNIEIAVALPELRSLPKPARIVVINDSDLVPEALASFQWNI